MLELFNLRLSDISMSFPGLQKGQQYGSESCFFVAHCRVFSHVRLSQSVSPPPQKNHFTPVIASQIRKKYTFFQVGPHSGCSISVSKCAGGHTKCEFTSILKATTFRKIAFHTGAAQPQYTEVGIALEQLSARSSRH